MFCRNCGKEMEDNAAVCVHCGFKAGTGDKYCANCGTEVTQGTAFCLNCGHAIEQQPTYSPEQQKSKLAAGLLGIFVGGLGVHNFYLGYTGKAIAQILLSFCFGAGAVWGLIEGILILAGTINKDANGVPLKD